MNSLSPDYQRHVIVEHAHPRWFSHLHWFHEAADRGVDVPPHWKALQDKPLYEVIDGLWGGESGHFPAYVAYLKEHLVCLMVGEGYRVFRDGAYTGEILPVAFLIYFIHDAELQTHTPLYERDYFMAGPPTPEEDIMAFEQMHGLLPEDYKALLRIHDFMYTINGDLTNSIAKEHLILRPVRHLGTRTAEDPPHEHYECLGIIGNTWDLPICLSRKVGQRTWEPLLMLAEGSGQICYDRDCSQTLDEFLSRP